MYKGKHKITIVLTPDHLTMASQVSGKVAKAERVALDPSRWNETWTGGLHSLDQPLRQLLARMGLGSSGCQNADLFYVSPSSICRLEISNLDEASSDAKMRNGLLESVGRSNPVDTSCLYKGDEASMVMGIADTEENLQNLFAWLNRSKVRVDRMIPSEAGVVQQAVLDAASVDEGSAILYLSDRSSVIGYYEQGVPKLARMTQIGYNKLIDVYQRALFENAEKLKDDNEGQGGQEGQDAGFVDEDQVRGAKPRHEFEEEAIAKLFELGIPVGTGKNTANQEDLMPAMAPILQRIAIEIKQTFRFASSLESMPSRLIICGPGSAIPKISAALSGSLDLHVGLDPRSKEIQPTVLFGDGTCVQNFVRNSRRLGIELVPKAANEIRIQRSLNRSIMVGSVVAGIFLGGQYMQATEQSGLVENLVLEQANTVSQIESNLELRDSIGNMAESIGTTANLIDEALGKRPDWVGVLGMLPADNREFIQISELEGKMNGDQPIVSISGMALDGPDGSTSAQELADYVELLKEIEQVELIKIGSTNKLQLMDQSWGLRFTLTLEITTNPGRFDGLMRLSTAREGWQP